MINNNLWISTQEVQPIPATELVEGYSWAHFTLNTILIVVIAICAILSVFYSFRYRRSVDAAIRGLNQAKMNISMGAMLISIAIVQIFLFEANWWRAIIGGIFLVMGIFNLFAGIRNRRVFINLVAKHRASK